MGMHSRKVGGTMPTRQTVYICGNWPGDNMSGLQRYADSIIHQLDRIVGIRKSEGREHLDIVLVSPADCSSYPAYCNIGIDKVGFKSKQGTFSFKIFSRLWKYIVFPLYRAVHPGIGVDLAQALPGIGIDLLAIHDCIRERFYAGDTSHFQRSYLRKIRWFSAKKRMSFVTVSQNSRNDLIDLYGIPEDRIHVIGNGWEHMRDVQPDLGVFERLGISPHDRFCFSLGTGEKHKHMDWVIRIAEINPEYTFLISGGEPSRFGMDVPDNVKSAGFLTDGEIKALYQHCSAFLQPSWYEGFAIPPLEALSAGAQIVISNNSCFPEIYGATGHYIDPARYDYRIDDLLAEPVDTPEAVLAEHTWAKAGEQMYALLERLASA